MTITAIYENGVLRPLTPLALREHTQVEIEIKPAPVPPDPLQERRRVHEVLVAAGLVLPRTEADLAMPEPLSSERREELAALFAAAGPLSTLIIEEREER